MSDSFALRLVRARTTSCRSPSRGRSRSRNDHFPRSLESRRWTRPIPTNRSFERNCWNFGSERKERHLFTWRWKRTLASAESSVKGKERRWRGRRVLYNRFELSFFNNTNHALPLISHEAQRECVDFDSNNSFSRESFLFYFPSFLPLIISFPLPISIPSIPHSLPISTPPIIVTLLIVSPSRR